MSTAQLVKEAGAVAVAVALLLTLAVVVLRLLALPLVIAVQVLDTAADITARPLTFTTTTDTERRCRR